MKKIIHILLLFFMVIGVSLAQDAIRYQGVAFDTNGAALQDQDISVLISILKNGPGGIFTYIESHALTTSGSGAFELNIGEGTEVAGAYTDIAWELGSYFLEVGIDIDGGTDYLTVGITEFLSVPYAQYSATASHGPPGDQGEPGDSGQDGDPGTNGANGQNGLPGVGALPGQEGQQGPQGPTGATGPQGLPGDPYPGPDTGITGPPGPKGETGPAGINGGLDGPDGASGAQGGQGLQGPSGLTGPTGEDGGSEGPQGLQGQQGPPGDPFGPTGDPGDPGPAGLNGTNGADGSVGPTGIDGKAIQVMFAVTPANPNLHDIYLDSGANRTDDQPGFRYFNGTEWIDLY